MLLLVSNVAGSINEIDTEALPDLTGAMTVTVSLDTMTAVSVETQPFSSSVSVEFSPQLTSMIGGCTGSAVVIVVVVVVVAVVKFSEEGWMLPEVGKPKGNDADDVGTNADVAVSLPQSTQSDVTNAEELPVLVLVLALALALALVEVEAGTDNGGDVAIEAGADVAGRVLQSRQSDVTESDDVDTPEAESEVGAVAIPVISVVTSSVVGVNDDASNSPCTTAVKALSDSLSWVT